ncbi:ADP-forming succinate--CoA ligase subunit beta [Acidiferrobacter sp. SPIII_3]|uniref:ADP-forming succinate--CoA ligase subunit beta n=1 Tax=Acidiferrobacter sp. SPIII_3 TaxID=1281578 RepID=UPI000D727FEB|nr:ADP-forming succinate--CoA ligase subunit beta [Acidiferrobacter sp. SPIII_3]AWP24967.1 ADP-forming succinate--CoA ligase subunit beta [Acidiferrobacter sp. SPIII_3]
MRLHEYQAKALLAAHGIATPPGVVVTQEREIDAALRKLAVARCVVKAQIHAGARGKAGGVRVLAADEVAAYAQGLLGTRLATPQTTADGLPVDSLLIETPVAAAAELYLACVVDRSAGARVLLAGQEGGMGVEEGAKPVAHVIDTVRGFSPYQGRALGRAIGLSGRAVAAFGDVVAALVALAGRLDAMLIEINPLMLREDGSFVAGDAKIEIDDNALFRQPALEALRDARQGDAKDEEARARGLQYIALDGDIGCLVNGAGLAMATMDLIAQAGGRPANFLDVGGGTTAHKVAEALTLLARDARVKVVLVNIFGGIVRCDLIAEGLLLAASGFGRPLPIVVRLVGTREAEGRQALADGGLLGDVTQSLEQAATLAVRRAQAS